MTCIHCRQVSCRAELARPPRPTSVVSLSAELTMKIIFLSDFCSLQTSIESRTAKNPSAGSRRDAHSFASWRSSKESDDKAWNATRLYGKSPWDECSTLSRGETSERRKKFMRRREYRAMMFTVCCMLWLQWERRRQLHEIKIHFHPLASCELHSNCNANSHLISCRCQWSSIDIQCDSSYTSGRTSTFSSTLCRNGTILLCSPPVWRFTVRP